MQVYVTALYLLSVASPASFAQSQPAIVAVALQDIPVGQSSGQCKDIASQLASEAASQLEGSNVKVKEEVAPRLQAFIENGAGKLKEATPDQCREAKENFTSFVSTLIKTAEKEPGPNDISERPPAYVTLESFNNAKSSICPLYPFC